jgi:hypothetical protein
VASSNQSRDHIYSALTLWNNSLYVQIGAYCDIPAYDGRVEQINTKSATVQHTFWTIPPGSGVYGGGVWGMGGASIDPATGDVYTATGNALSTPESYSYAEHVVQLSSNLKVLAAQFPGLDGTDSDIPSTPMLYQSPGCPARLAVKSKTGQLIVYNRNSIANGPVQQIQMTTGDGSFQNEPAYDPLTNMLYVSNSSDYPPGSPTYLHGLVALKVQADCSLALAWQQPVGQQPDVVPPPTVANGVVYYGDGGDAHVYAFDAATGRYLWDSGSSLQEGVHGANTVVNGRLYVGSDAGQIAAFGL